jgi:nuclear cap-binding protein subunit 2
MDAADPEMTDSTAAPPAEALKESDPVVSSPVTRRVVVPPAPRAAELASANDETKRLYWDRSHYKSPAQQMEALAKSSTLYIGNLAFSTRSRHVRAHFAQIGPVRSVQMGLDRLKKTPCGFCFVEYHYRTDALAAVANLSGTKLDGRVIRVELDAGFQPGRQYGRGLSGGQVRDDRRTAADPARKRDRDAEGQPSRTEGNSSSGAGAGGGGYYGPGDEPSAKRQRT